MEYCIEKSRVNKTDTLLSSMYIINYLTSKRVPHNIIQCFWITLLDPQNGHI